MIKVRRIGHVTFETPDLDRQIEHFTQVTGLVVAAREKDRALLATRLGQLVVQLRRADEPRCAKLAFQVAPESDFKELARALSDDGIKSELRSDDLRALARRVLRLPTIDEIERELLAALGRYSIPK